MNLEKNNHLNNFIKYKNNSYNFPIIIIFQLFLDLCLFRGWKNIRIFIDNQKKSFLLISINPKKKKNKFEIFLPFKKDSKFDFNNIFQMFEFVNKKNNILYLKKINLAFLDQENTFTFYRITSMLNKSIGPLGRY
jgi:hypothetical protein